MPSQDRQVVACCGEAAPLQALGMIPMATCRSIGRYINIKNDINPNNNDNLSRYGKHGTAVCYKNVLTHDRHGVVGCGDTVMLQVLGLRLLEACEVLTAIMF